MRAIIGIDPGLTGAIACINGRSVVVEVLPTIENGSKAKIKQEIDAATLRRYILNLEGASNPDGVVAYLEHVSAMPAMMGGKVVQGGSSTFSLGDTFGAIRGVLACLGIPVVRVRPQVWKKQFKLGSDKEQARATAVWLFPQIPLTRKKDHNLAEALLIAEWGRLQEGK